MVIFGEFEFTALFWHLNNFDGNFPSRFWYFETLNFHALFWHFDFPQFLKQYEIELRWKFPALFFTLPGFQFEFPALFYRTRTYEKKCGSIQVPRILKCVLSSANSRTFWQLRNFNLNFPALFFHLTNSYFNIPHFMICE